jgi:hypothetical protein
VADADRRRDRVDGSLHEHATTLYGRPRDPLPRTSSAVTPEDLAERIHEVLAGLVDLEMGLTPPPSHTAEEVAAQLVAGLREVFGEAAPPVAIVDDLSANAAASARGIRVRRDASFTDRDGAQLLQHEAFIHVATALNGRRQPLRILAMGHPGTTGPGRGSPCSPSSRAAPRNSTGCAGSPTGSWRSRW